MRLLLDEHFSARWIGIPLQQDGHDVRVATEAELQGTPDAALLDIAIAESRILITADPGDFIVILQQFAENGRTHGGVILVPKSIPNHAFGQLLRGIRNALSDTNHDIWLNRVVWLAR